MEVWVLIYDFYIHSLSNEPRVGKSTFCPHYTRKMYSYLFNYNECKQLKTIKLQIWK